jgi:hypothetical protein
MTNLTEAADRIITQIFEQQDISKEAIDYYHSFNS